MNTNILLRNNKYQAPLTAILLFLMAVSACKLSKAPKKDLPSSLIETIIVPKNDSTQAAFTDTLVAATLYGPTSFFIYRGENFGYQYSLVKDFAAYNHCALKLVIAPTLQAAITLLDEGTVQLIAYDVPITSHYKSLVLPCGNEAYSTQVLVQPKEKGSAPIENVTALVGKDVYVTANSKYSHRLKNLEYELAAEITIHEISPDSASDEELIAMVANGSIPLTVVDSDIAQLNETYYHDLDISTPISTPQRASWAVALGNTTLAKQVDLWFSNEVQSAENALLLKRYFELSKAEPYTTFDLSKGYISRFDNLFRTYSSKINWDWRLMAAQAYAESMFRPNARSWVGATGLMQIMPRTAAGYGVAPASLNDPATSVRVASRLLADLDRYLADAVPNDSERRKFTLAAYNCGIAHIYDAIALAKKYSLDPQKWDDNVERALLMKMNPTYYNDPIVKYGYARGSETSAYIKRIMEFYENAVREIPFDQKPQQTN